MSYTRVPPVSGAGAITSLPTVSQVPIHDPATTNYHQIPGSTGITSLPPADTAPTLALTDPNGDIANPVVGDTILASVTVADITDGSNTTGVNIYESGVLVGAAARTDPPSVWTLSFQLGSGGNKSYTAQRTTANATTTSNAVALSVLAALAPTALSVTLIAQYETGSPGSFTLGTTPEPFGTTPPGVTYSGTRTLAQGAWVKILTTGGARGTAKFRTYLDGLGVTSVEGADQTTAATYVIPGTAVTVNFPVGTYATNNIYKGIANPIVDQSGNAYDLNNATSTTRPLVVTAGPIASLPVWRFDGSNDTQVGPSAAATAVWGGTDNSFMGALLCNLNAVPSGASVACLVAACHTTDANVPLVEFRMSSTAYQIVRRATAANSKSASSGTLPSTGKHLFVWGFDGINAFLRDNGVYIIGGDSGVTAALALGAATTFNQFSVAARSINSGIDEFCSMDMLALAFHDAVPATLAEIERYEMYFLGS